MVSPSAMAGIRRSLLGISRSNLVRSKLYANAPKMSEHLEVNSSAGTGLSAKEFASLSAEEVLFNYGGMMKESRNDAERSVP